VVLGEQVGAPATLRITDLPNLGYWPSGVVAVQALAAVAVYTVLAGFAAHPDLHPDGAKALVDDPGYPQPMEWSQARAWPPEVMDGRPQDSDGRPDAGAVRAPAGDPRAAVDPGVRAAADLNARDLPAAAEPGAPVSSGPGVASGRTDSPERP
jgi:hypothetical protein